MPFSPTLISNVGAVIEEISIEPAIWKPGGRTAGKYIELPPPEPPSSSNNNVVAVEGGVKVVWEAGDVHLQVRNAD